MGDSEEGVFGEAMSLKLRCSEENRAWSSECSRKSKSLRHSPSRALQESTRLRTSWRWIWI